MPKKIAKEWTKPLSNAAKAEMLAATFHLFTDHMPKEFAKLPTWLQQQMRRTMYDCGVDFRDLTKQDTADLKEYGAWLNARFPQETPKKRQYHFAIMSGFKDIGQVGCCWGESIAEAEKSLPSEDHGKLVRMRKDDCPVCNEELMGR